MRPRIGSLFSGYGGLDCGVMQAIGGSVAWHAEIEKAPSKILAHHWPDVPNHGDITAIDFRKVEQVDILTGGFPCQDVSHAGRRAGLGPGTRTGLWSHMARAIDELRPSLVVAENVRGLLSAKANSDVEPCPWCVGDPDTPDLRALGAVLADLADLGYDAAWYGLRAADIGAPHGRFRVFVAAWPAADTKGDAWRIQHGDRDATADADSLGLERGGRARDGWAGPADGRLLPTPTSRDGKGRNQRGDDTCLTGALMPTPRATDGTKGGPNQRGSSGDLMLPSAVTLLPTPTSADSKASGANGYNGNEFCTLTDATVRRPENWGIYAEAIARWEALTRPAPAPTQLSKKGTPQLSPAFSEWLMGLPAGHVTGVPGLSRNDQLKALGNGVVPHQATVAIERLLPIIPCEVAA